MTRLHWFRIGALACMGTTFACSDGGGWDYCPSRAASGWLPAYVAKHAKALSATNGCRASCYAVYRGSKRCDFLYVTAVTETKCEVRLELDDGTTVVSELEFRRGVAPCTDVYPVYVTAFDDWDGGYPEAGEGGAEEAGAADASIPDSGPSGDAGGVDAEGGKSDGASSESDAMPADGPDEASDAGMD